MIATAEQGTEDQGTKIDATWVFTVTHNWLNEQKTGQPFLIHRGGTRSGKTYNACIAWASYLRDTDAPERLSIVRATGPALKASVVRDMIEVLRRMNLYSEDLHHKSAGTITLPGSGSIIEYFPTDDDQKVHGRTRHHLWANETNEIPFEAWRQLNLRTKGRKMMDFNPSFSVSHWINETYRGNPLARWYTSTYLDNPYITAEQRREIEALKTTDPWAWKVYGLGQTARPAAAIFHHLERLSQWTHGASPLGLDFGYNDPMSLCRVMRVDAEPVPELHIWSLLHESHLTTKDLIQRLPDLGVAKHEPILCDHEPDRIEQMQRAGYNAMPANKTDKKGGIDWMKQHRLRIGGPAIDRAWPEFENYRWRMHAGTTILMDKPIDRDDHAPDAARYGSGYFRKQQFRMW